MMDLFFVMVILAGFCLSVLLGALCAKLFGFRLNEPEYYEHRKRNDEH